MTTSKLTAQYYRGNSESAPRVEVRFYAGTWTYFKLFVMSVIGRPLLLDHTLSDSEISGLYKMCVKWKIVTSLKLRNREGLADVATAPVLKTGER